MVNWKHERSEESDQDNALKDDQQMRIQSTLLEATIRVSLSFLLVIVANHIRRVECTAPSNSGSLLPSCSEWYAQRSLEDIFNPSTCSKPTVRFALHVSASIKLMGFPQRRWLAIPAPAALSI